jgi:hypothetical protein
MAIPHSKCGKVKFLTLLASRKLDAILCLILKNITRKAQFVAIGHTTTAPSSLTYSSVVSRDSIRLVFLVAALNNIDIMSCDLENAYRNAPCREKICFEGGIECGKDHGKVCVVVRSLYGLKSAGEAFWSSLAQILQDLGYESLRANPDMWIQKAVRDDGHEYYKCYLFTSMTSWLSVTKQAEDAIKEITAFMKAKEGIIKPPDIYLGVNISKIQLPDGQEEWTTLPRTYVKNFLLVVERLLEEDGEGYVLKSNVCNPFPTGYKPEINITDKFNQNLASRYI